MAEVSSEAAPALPCLPKDLLEVLPEGFVTEICPAATAWWRQAAQALQTGKLLAIDYGLTEAEFFTPARSQGTLRAYHRHQASLNVLNHPGEQDLTAHVNFTRLQAAGEAHGLVTEAQTSQAGFLTGLARQRWENPAANGDWSAGEIRQFQTLTHPEHLGRAFRVLVQSRARRR
jgi:SAM-dependent MidA family methyltransferase